MSGLDYHTTTRYVFALATSTTQYQFHPSTNVTISITYLRCDQASTSYVEGDSQQLQAVAAVILN